MRWYLATAVSVAQQFLHGVNRPQYDFVISVAMWPTIIVGQVIEMDSFRVGMFLERNFSFPSGHGREVLAVMCTYGKLVEPTYLTACCVWLNGV
jgi:membrane-associated phospholipid phosphatase